MKKVETSPIDQLLKILMMGNKELEKEEKMKTGTVSNVHLSVLQYEQYAIKARKNCY